MKSPLSSQPRPQAVIFDWDNTLVDSWPSIMEIINLTRVKFGLPAWDIEQIKINCTRAAKESFPIWFGNQWEDAYKFYYTNFEEMRKALVLRPLSGSSELLAWLKKENIPAFVVSNKRGDFLRIEIEKSGWKNHFVAVAGSTDAPHDKPHRAHVDFALGQGGLTANKNIWFVGDSETDVICARNSGCTPVLINHPDEAQKLNVDMSFNDCAELLKQLQQL